MKRSRFSVEKIFQILTEGESKTFSVAEVCRKYNISGNTYYILPEKIQRSIYSRS